MMLRPFHLAFPVTCLESAESFYVNVLGASVGRRDDRWIDFNLFGHQVTAHYIEEDATLSTAGVNPVDGDAVPVPHFGVILSMHEWRKLAAKLEKRDDTRWVIRPRTRFQGLAGEQATMFLQDPSANNLEFKAFERDAEIFSATPQTEI